MRKIISTALITTLFLSLFACAPDTPEEIPEETTLAATAPITTPPVTTVAETTTVPETKDTTEILLPKSKGEYADENGLITPTGVERINSLIKSQEKSSKGYGVYAGLFDFDRNGIPEVYIVKHSGNQGTMPTDIFSLDGELLGGFDGYCRDGFCRLSYGKDCVYVRNYYEHSMHQRINGVQKLTFNNGKINSEYLFRENGNTNNYPLLKFDYYINSEKVDEQKYFDKYNSYLFEDTDLMSREANEFSICAYDMDVYDTDIMAESICEVYNSYISGKNKATKLFGKEPQIYAFDDFDGDGRYEAFIEDTNNAEYWHFWNGKELFQSEKTSNIGDYDYTRCGNLLIIEPFSNGAPCRIFGVKNGEPYTHEMSGYGKLVRVHPENCLNRLDLENGIFVLRQSRYDAMSLGSHTFKPYFFDYELNELVGVPVARENFSDRADVQAEFDKIENEIKAKNGKIKSAFLRGERYLNISYTTPIMNTQDDGSEVYVGADNNYYKTFMIQNTVTLIDEGRGLYNASIKDK